MKKINTILMLLIFLIPQGSFAFGKHIHSLNIKPPPKPFTRSATLEKELANSDASFLADPGAKLGHSITGIGDINGDNLEDFAMGATYYQDSNDDYVGKVYIVFGKVDGWSIDTNLLGADASFIGEDNLDLMGYSLAGVDDINGDGYDDFIIGGWGWVEQEAKAYLILGKADGWQNNVSLSNADASFIWEEDSNQTDWEYSNIDGIGDINNDSLDDFAIGAYGSDEGGADSGQTYIFFGKATGWSLNTNLSTADASFIGENSGDQSGASVAGVKDVNGDNISDFIINAYGYSGYSGKTYLIFGKESGWQMDVNLSTADASFVGENSGDMSGFCLDGAGDINNDNYNDFILASDYHNSSTGKVYIILGKENSWSNNLSLSNSDASYIGENIKDMYECRANLSGIGDFNDDGFDDFVIGSAGYGGTDVNEIKSKGKTYLILGRNTGWTNDINLANADLSYLGENEIDNSGAVVAGVGDVNGDGHKDFIVGARENEEAGADSGQVYLILGE